MKPQKIKNGISTYKPFKTTPLEQMPHIYRMGWCNDYPDENNWVHDVFNN
jgi:hypothetical protein